MTGQDLGYFWCLKNADQLVEHHNKYLAVRADGIQFTHWDEEEFEAWWNDLRPSEQRETYRTHTSLWIVMEADGV